MTLDEPVLMGIVNVTLDSFSDGGQFFDADKAIAHGKKLYAEGARILDIGGESTRPGAVEVSIEEEIRRVVPVIEGLRDTGAILSIDTRHAAVMKEAISAGAGFINDVSALTHDPQSLNVAVESGAYVCLMHMKGTPESMQVDPSYDNVFDEVYRYLENRIADCVAAGVNRSRLYIDPGIGFGKNLDHNLALLARLGDFQKLDVPVLLGASRKRFIQGIDPAAGPADRLGGSLAACIAGYKNGVRHFRVHDVAATKQALSVTRAIETA